MSSFFRWPLKTIVRKFPHFQSLIPQKQYHLIHYNFSNGLIGYETIKNLGVEIYVSNSLLNTPNSKLIFLFQTHPIGALAPECLNPYWYEAENMGLEWGIGLGKKTQLKHLRLETSISLTWLRKPSSTVFAMRLLQRKNRSLLFTLLAPYATENSSEYGEWSYSDYEYQFRAHVDIDHEN